MRSLQEKGQDTGQEKGQDKAGVTVLSIDIGGTKTLVSLVRSGRVVKLKTLETARDTSPEDWFATLRDAVRRWDATYQCVGVAVTGHIENGYWKSVNDKTLAIGNSFNLADAVSRFGCPFEILNDAQAAAWAEYVYGSGSGTDLVYLTVSTGLGGGIVCNGKLLKGHRGLAGHFGQIAQNLMSEDEGAEPIEDMATGRWMLKEAEKAGLNIPAREIFDEAGRGDSWSRRIISASAWRIAKICRDILYTIDPPAIVIGGGIGLGKGFIAEVQHNVAQLAPSQETRIRASSIKEHAGIIGVAAIAAQSYLETGERHEQIQ